MEIAMIHGRHLSELATWQFRKFHDTRWVLWPKNTSGCVKTQHLCPGAKTVPASSGKIESAYNENTSIGMTVSWRNSYDGFPTDTVIVLTLSLHAATELKRRSGRPGGRHPWPPAVPSAGGSHKNVASLPGMRRETSRARALPSRR